MSIIKSHQYNKTQPEGSWLNPIYLPEPEPLKQMAAYLGYELKWDVGQHKKYWWKTHFGEAADPLFYCKAVYKQGNSILRFTTNIVDVYLTLETMQKRGHYDADLQEAWASLDCTKTFNLIVEKLTLINNGTDTKQVDRQNSEA